MAIAKPYLHCISWRQGTVASVGRYGYTLEDGSKHGFHHVKPSPAAGNLNNVNTSIEPVEILPVSANSLVLFNKDGLQTICEVYVLDTIKQLYAVKSLHLYEDCTKLATSKIWTKRVRVWAMSKVYVVSCRR